VDYRWERGRLLDSVTYRDQAQSQVSRIG
jgi:hypothetical protein